MVEQMRAITDTAWSTTRKARRDAERRNNASAVVSRAKPAAAPPDDIPVAASEAGKASEAGPVAPFEVIEPW